MSPDPCLGFSSSSFDPSDPPPIAPNPLAVAPDPTPQPPPYVPSSLLPSQVQQLPTPLPSQCLRQALRPQPHPLPWSQGFTPASLDPLSIAGLNNLKTGNFTAGPCSFPCSTPPFTGSSWSRRHCSVHVPFSLTDLSQGEKHLGFFSSDPDYYLKEFKYLTQAYGLTWHDIYIMLSSTFLPEEKVASLAGAC